MSELEKNVKALVCENNLTENDVSLASQVVNFRWDKNFHSEIALASAVLGRKDVSRDDWNSAGAFLVGTCDGYGQGVKMLAHIKRYTNFCFNISLKVEFLSFVKIYQNFCICGVNQSSRHNVRKCVFLKVQID